MKFTLVPATESDKDFLLSLRKQTMTEHFENSHLFLTDEEHLARVEYQFDDFSLLEYNNTIIGALKYASTELTTEIMQLQLLPEYQGKGFGSAIIKQIIEASPAPTVHLTVLQQNPARRLYQRLGFKIVGKDKYEFHMQLDKDSTR